MAQKPFSVIRFIKDNTSEFVPSKWIFETEGISKVKFPKQKNSKTSKLQRDSESVPNPNWNEWEIEVIKCYGKCSFYYLY